MIHIPLEPFGVQERKKLGSDLKNKGGYLVHETAMCGDRSLFRIQLQCPLIPWVLHLSICCIFHNQKVAQRFQASHLYKCISHSKRNSLCPSLLSRVGHMPTAEPIRRLDCFDGLNLGTCFIPEPRTMWILKGMHRSLGHSLASSKSCQWALCPQDREAAKNHWGSKDHWSLR